MPELPRPIRFSASGAFRILQLTDVHLRPDSLKSAAVLSFMRDALALVKPDLVMLTGDLVLTDQLFVEGWHDLVRPMVDAGIPWAMTLGNHDAQYAYSREQVYELAAGLPGNAGVSLPLAVYGPGDYILPVYASAGDKVQALLYAFDSHDCPDRQEWGTYAWIQFDQIAWYRAQSAALAVRHGRPLPALAFFHIPLPEYRDIRRLPTTVGRAEEAVCCPELNSGLFAAMLEQGDVMGVFVGHDHDCNYIGALHGICLAYGGVTGLNCYGKIERGARVIELAEGARAFTTYFLTHDLRELYRVRYPDDFVSVAGL